MNNVSVDDSAVRNLFQALDEESRKRILFTALKAGGEKLLSETKVQLRSKLSSGATSPNRWNGKTMESGIRVKGDKILLITSVPESSLGKLLSLSALAVRM